MLATPTAPHQDHRRSIAALYQEVTNALENLTSPLQQHAKRNNNNRRRHEQTKPKHWGSIRRDTTSHWVVPTYGDVLHSIRSTAPFVPVHSFTDAPTPTPSVAAKSSFGHITANNKRTTFRGRGHATPTPSQKFRPPSASNDSRRMHDNDDGTASTMSSLTAAAAAAAAERRSSKPSAPPPELAPHEKYQVRATVLCQFAKESNMTLQLLLSLYQHLIKCMLPLSSATSSSASTVEMEEENEKEEEEEEEDVIMLAHVFLREIGKLLPTEALRGGLDELIFINFDIECVGTLDVREFIFELACCDALGLSVEQMVNILFYVYGQIDVEEGADENDDNYIKERVISSELVAGLMHRGVESTRVLVQSVERFLAAMDTDGDGTITWTEYIEVIEQDRTILDSFRQSYSVSSRSDLGVMMFSPLNRFLRRCSMNWLLLTKMWNTMNTTGSQYHVVGGINKSDQSKSEQEQTKNPDYKQPSRVLLTYNQFRSVVQPFFGKGRSGDATLLSELFDAANAHDVMYTDKQGNAMQVADCHRFVIDLSTSLEDSAPSMGSATIQRARFYFMVLDLDRSGTIEYDEVYEVVCRGQSVGLARHILHGRKLMRQVDREEDGYITEDNFLKATKAHPDLLWWVVHRYPFE